MNWFYIFLSMFFLMGCELSGVQKDTSPGMELDSLQLSSKIPDTPDTAFVAASVTDTVIRELTLDNGIRISWLKEGKGDLLKTGDMLSIDFRNQLEDGTIYDGNHLIQKKSIPFLLGWGQQTPGWDIALTYLRVGDEADIFIPSSLARGEKGIEGIVPPNANNILSIRILNTIAPDYNDDGIRIWRVEETKKEKKQITHESRVAIHYWVSTQYTPRFDNSYKRGYPFELKMGDGNIVPGLYKALLRGRTGDKLMVHIPAIEAYGSQGLSGLVKSNEDIFYDLIILDVE
jgi:FKBP-type peptidyl-prolyl cis-trans isomerase